MNTTMSTRATTERTFRINGFGLAAAFAERYCSGTRQMIHLRCESQLVLVDPGFGELGWCSPAMGAVGSVDLLVDSPVLEKHLCLEQSLEELTVQVLVAQAAVEALDPGILLRGTGIDEDGVGLVESTPVFAGCSSQPVGAENAIQGPHAASLYSWMRSPSLSVLRSRDGSGSPIVTGIDSSVRGAR